MRLKLAAFVVTALAVTGGAQLLPAQAPANNAQQVQVQRSSWARRHPNGLRDESLDAAWQKYDTSVREALQQLIRVIEKKREAAANKGQLEAVQKWDAVLAKAKQGILPEDKELALQSSKADQAITKARNLLTDTYDELVKALTKQNNVQKAAQAQSEREAIALERGKVVFRKFVFLSDLAEEDVVVGFGQFGKNGDAGYNNLRIVVGGVESPKGLSMHAKERGISRVTYSVPAGMTRFEATAAINDDAQGNQQTPVTFQVASVKQGVLWRSRPLLGGGSKEKCDIKLNGAKDVILSVECPGNGHAAQAVWVEPRFLVQ